MREVEIRIQSKCFGSIIDKPFTGHIKELSLAEITTLFSDGVLYYEWSNKLWMRYYITPVNSH